MAYQDTGVNEAGAVSSGGAKSDRDDAEVLTLMRTRLTMAIAALSDWAVGNLVGPTAVQVVDLSAAAQPIGWPETIGLMLAAALIVGVGGWLRRRRSMILF